MIKQGHILIIDDDEDILVAAKLLLRRHQLEVTTCNDPEQIPRLLANGTYSAIMLDMNFGPGESSGAEGLKWLQHIRDALPECPIVMITAHGGMNLAIEAMKIGATDFVIKPWHNEKLIATVSAANQLGTVRKEAKQLRDTHPHSSNLQDQVERPTILGNSAPMHEVMTLVAKSAPTDANVLILGENGTGKELLARDIHFKSTRADKMFMSVDLGAVSETLFESELFGHKKGAFTGANADRIGKIETADGGTLFLDELGNLPLHLQAKLLTVLEQRALTPLGANKAKPFNVRLICATNVKKADLLDESRFRQDLLFRLNTVELTLPPLRERPDDILPIAHHFIDLYANKYGKSKMILSSDARRAMIKEPWQGNIRALRHAIERAVILSSSHELLISDFSLASSTDSANTSSKTASQQSHSSTQIYSNEHTGVPDSEASHHQKNEDVHPELNLEQVEKRTVEQALRTYRYNISHTAKALGLTRAALYRRMEKHGL